MCGFEDYKCHRVQTVAYMNANLCLTEANVVVTDCAISRGWILIDLQPGSSIEQNLRDICFLQQTKIVGKQ
jgi:hypothetical protein